MVQKHIRMELDTFKKLQERAKKNKRSLNMEMNAILEDAVNTEYVTIPLAKSNDSKYIEYLASPIDPRD